MVSYDIRNSLAWALGQWNTMPDAYVVVLALFKIQSDPVGYRDSTLSERNEPQYHRTSYFDSLVYHSSILLEYMLLICLETG